jgi:hypothetical protein
MPLNPWIASPPQMVPFSILDRNTRPGTYTVLLASKPSKNVKLDGADPIGAGEIGFVGGGSGGVAINLLEFGTDSWALTNGTPCLGVQWGNVILFWQPGSNPCGAS